MARAALARRGGRGAGHARFVTFLEASKLEAQATGYAEAMRLVGVSKKLVEGKAGGFGKEIV